MKRFAGLIQALTIAGTYAAPPTTMAADAPANCTTNNLEQSTTSGRVTVEYDDHNLVNAAGNPDYQASL
jgi:hypothetical protein